MDQILIQDLLVHGIIGVYDEERQAPQDILINLALSVDLSQAGESDNLADSVNYAEIAAQVRQVAENARRFTVEALASDLAKLCLSDPRVHSVRVRVEKPAILPGCRSVGVEIERSQPD